MSIRYFISAIYPPGKRHPSPNDARSERLAGRKGDQNRRFWKTVIIDTPAALAVAARLSGYRWTRRDGPGSLVISHRR